MYGSLMLIIYFVANEKVRNGKFGILIKWVCPVIGIPLMVLEFVNELIKVIENICL